MSFKPVLYSPNVYFSTDLALLLFHYFSETWTEIMAQKLNRSEPASKTREIYPAKAYEIYAAKIYEILVRRVPWDSRILESTENILLPPRHKPSFRQTNTSGQNQRHIMSGPTNTSGQDQRTYQVRTNEHIRSGPTNTCQDQRTYHFEFW